MAEIVFCTLCKWFFLCKLLNCWLLGPMPRGAGAQESVFNQHCNDSDAGGENPSLRMVLRGFCATFLVLSGVWMSWEVLFQVESIHWSIVYQDQGKRRERQKDPVSAFLMPPVTLFSHIRKQKLRGDKWLPQGHTAQKRPIWTLNSGLSSTPSPVLFPFHQPHSGSSSLEEIPYMPSVKPASTDLKISSDSHQTELHEAEQARSQKAEEEIIHKALRVRLGTRKCPECCLFSFQLDTRKNVQAAGNMLAAVGGVDRSSCKNRLVRPAPGTRAGLTAASMTKSLSSLKSNSLSLLAGCLCSWDPTRSGVGAV